jgi:hypothetical protein
MIPLDTRVSVRRVTIAVLCWGWLAAWAGVEVVKAEPNLASLPWLQIVVGVAIASWGGATATLGRYLASSYAAKPFHWKIEAVRDGFVSITVGAGSYLGGAWYGLSPMLLGLVLLLAGYLGVRVLSGAAERLLSMVERRPL